VGPPGKGRQVAGAEAAKGRILIVDDSATARLAMRRALETEPGLSVVAEASSRRLALAALEQVGADLVILDVHLRDEDGVDLAAEIMQISPRPILIVTGIDPDSPTLAFRALEAGALDVLAKLPSDADPAYEPLRRRLVRTVRALAEVPVVTRRRRRAPVRPVVPSPSPRRPRRPGVVVVGASTGGPPVLEQLLRDLAAPLPVPVVVVQHIAAGFVQGLASWLSNTTGHPTVVCHGATVLEPGAVYFAPDGLHLAFSGPRLVSVDDSPPRGFHKPAIDRLFETAALHAGADVVGVLLTGMGQDGAAGLAALRQAGAATVAQEPSTCIVGSMPSAAIKRGAAEVVAAPAQLGAAVTRCVLGG